MASPTVQPNQPRPVPPRPRLGTHRTDPLFRLTRPTPASRLHVPKATRQVEALTTVACVLLTKDGSQPLAPWPQTSDEILLFRLNNATRKRW